MNKLSDTLDTNNPFAMDEAKYSEYLPELDPMATIKQELPGLAQDMGPSSASVPIPGNHRAVRSAYDQFSPSPLANTALWGGSNHQGDFLLDSPFKLEMQEPVDPLLSFKMDDDDIFQVDKSDLIGGPTLAELNANDDTLLGDLNFDDLLLPDETMQPVRSGLATDLMTALNSMNTINPNQFASSSFPQPVQTYRNYPTQANVSGFGFNTPLGMAEPVETISPTALPNLAGSSTASSSTSPRPVVRPIVHSTLHELLMNKVCA